MTMVLLMMMMMMTISTYYDYSYCPQEDIWCAGLMWAVVKIMVSLGLWRSLI